MGVDARVIPAADGQSLMALRLIANDDLLQMLPRQRRFPMHAERLPQVPMGFDEQHRINLRMGEADKLFLANRETRTPFAQFSAVALR